MYFSQRILHRNIVRNECQIDDDYTTESHKQEEKDIGVGTAEMGQCLRAFASSYGGPGSGPSNHLATYNFLLLQFQRIDAPCGFLELLHVCEAQKLTGANTHTYRINQSREGGERRRERACQQSGLGSVKLKRATSKNMFSCSSEGRNKQL